MCMWMVCKNLAAVHRERRRTRTRPWRCYSGRVIVGTDWKAKGLTCAHPSAMQAHPVLQKVGDLRCVSVLSLSLASYWSLCTSPQIQQLPGTRHTFLLSLGGGGGLCLGDQGIRVTLASRLAPATGLRSNEIKLTYTCTSPNIMLTYMHSHPFTSMSHIDVHSYFMCHTLIRSHTIYTYTRLLSVAPQLCVPQDLPSSPVC